MCDWDDGNVEHIALHGVEPAEAEEALADARRLPSAVYSVPGERRRGMVGMTERDRLLFVVYTYRADSIRVVTASEATEREARRYRSRPK